MKVIVGLGNPGKEYENTRHNAGFIVVDNYLGNVSWKEEHKALISESRINGEKVLFVKPLTFMNNSGDSIKEILSYYKLSSDDLLVIQDDIALSLGKWRIKYESSDGGHNGIKSIINNLGTNKFWRLKIGLAKENENIDTVSYVLGRLTKKEIDQMNSDFNSYFQVIDSFILGNIKEVK